VSVHPTTTCLTLSDRKLAGPIRSASILDRQSTEQLIEQLIHERTGIIGNQSGREQCGYLPAQSRPLSDKARVSTAPDMLRIRRDRNASTNAMQRRKNELASVRSSRQWRVSTEWRPTDRPTDRCLLQKYVDELRSRNRIMVR